MALALLVAGCGGEGEAADDAPSRARVNIASFDFVPGDVRVKAGAEITFVNQDDAPHTAQVGRSGRFDTDRLDLGDEATLTVDRPGRFTYFCLYHRFMEGTVEVVE